MTIKKGVILQEKQPVCVCEAKTWILFNYLQWYKSVLCHWVSGEGGIIGISRKIQPSASVAVFV